MFRQPFESKLRADETVALMALMGASLCVSSDFLYKKTAEGTLAQADACCDTAVDFSVMSNSWFTSQALHSRLAVKSLGPRARAAEVRNCHILTHFL